MGNCYAAGTNPFLPTLSLLPQAHAMPCLLHLRLLPLSGVRQWVSHKCECNTPPLAPAHPPTTWVTHKCECHALPPPHLRILPLPGGRRNCISCMGSEGGKYGVLTRVGGQRHGRGEEGAVRTSECRLVHLPLFLLPPGPSVLSRLPICCQSIPCPPLPPPSGLTKKNMAKPGGRPTTFKHQ